MELSKYFEEVIVSRDLLEKYSTDYSYISPVLSSQKKLPKAIVKIKTEEDIEKIIELMNEYHFPVIVRGNGTNTLGATIPIKENTVILDITKFKGFERGKDYIISKPGTEFNDMPINELPLIPTSFYMATIGGFIEGGSLGFGSLKNGAIWDNVIEAEVYTLKGKYKLEGSNVYSVVQSAGTTGILTKAKIKLSKTKRKNIKIFKQKFNTMNEALDFSLNLLDNAEFISIRNLKMAKEIEPNENWSKWNVVYGIDDDEEEKTNKNFQLKDIITTFAGAYFTVVNKTGLPYNSLDIPIENIEKIQNEDCYISAELSKSSNKYFSHTYFIGCSKLPNLGKQFNLHSYIINNRVEDERLKYIIEFKRKVDPEDLFNSGKLIF
ncbi:FAD-binding protein [Acidianus sulfidivorans JP7]|uniref:FAD-binding PCMH-type domain-containing protein n=1 Tax=Acidianus sulfidivorans JP7 TaxID=619593 RepID=A0A2U9ILH5_9CREN|nr:FAD-binding oxidoreductase [Acidianus sulfidivorans]AWR96845.1 FAD-binding protein [Acidianus sulfidivorans JP7]